MMDDNVVPVSSMKSAAKKAAVKKPGVKFPVVSDGSKTKELRKKAIKKRFRS